MTAGQLILILVVLSAPLLAIKCLLLRHRLRREIDEIIQRAAKGPLA